MRFKLPWPRRKQAPIVEAQVSEPYFPLPVPQSIEPEKEPAKALTHVLEWVPTGWATFEVDKGDGKWQTMSYSRVPIVYNRCQRAEQDLEAQLTAARQELDAQEKGNREWTRLFTSVEQFSKIRYRVREWGDEETNWVRHSVGMERPLRRIMETLVEDGHPPDRLLLRELREGEA